MSGFVTAAQPRPALDLRAAAALLRDGWGLRGRLQELGSQQDRNVRVTTTDGTYVLKVANAGVARPCIEAQHAAMRLLDDRLPHLVVPLPLPAADGAEIVEVQLPSGTHLARVLTFVEGEPLSDARHLAPAVLRAVGGMLGEVTHALADLDHPGARYRSQWDIRHTGELVAELAPSLATRERRLVEDAVALVAGTVADAAGDAPLQVCHADAHDGNITSRAGSDGRPVPSGLIDFGDLVRTWRIADLAIAATPVVGRAPGDPLPDVVALAAGFDARLRLTDAELTLLWPAVVWRAAGDACATAYGRLIDPANTYTAAAVEDLLRISRAVLAIPPALAESALRSGLGRRPSPAARRLGALRTAAPPADLLPPGDAEVRRAHGAVVASLEPTRSAPATRSLGLVLGVRAGAPLAAPLAGTVAATSEQGMTLACDDAYLHLRGVAPVAAAGAAVSPGDPLAAAGAGGEVRVTTSVPGLDPPELVPAGTWPAWDAVCRDPSPLLGLPAARAPAAVPLLARRRAVLGRSQAHYYEEPPEIERGAGALLVDRDGRAYIDVINNVAVAGHSHPDVNAAVAAQMARLNTNSRFLYEPLVAYAERLAALLPPPLDTVFVVNSGSEANELALRLARSATGGHHILHLDDSYHGWTAATAAISGELPESRDGSLPSAELAMAITSPNPYRGRHRGPDAGRRALGDVDAALRELAGRGRHPAAFISEALLGNAGGAMLPDGYLAEVYARVRAAGGLCIADEVQVGFGRTGERLWGFALHGVVPDVVTVAKAAGNGYPLGAVATTRAIAEAFADRSCFFSSAGGSPAGCAAGIAVLDVLEREGLQANARRVGAQLRAGLEDLATRHELVGAVHGIGLYLGVELVRDRATLEPAAEEALAICERMLRLGVVVQPTSVHGNVLKVKPPLCITAEQAGAFVERLDEVLTDGW